MTGNLVFFRFLRVPQKVLNFSGGFLLEVVFTKIVECPGTVCAGALFDDPKTSLKGLGGVVIFTPTGCSG
jgi:hypothetical protein